VPDPLAPAGDQRRRAGQAPPLAAAACRHVRTSLSRSICADSRRPPGRGALSDPVYLCVVASTSAAVGAPSSSSSSTCTHAPAPHTTRASSGRCSSLFYSKRCHTYTHTYIYPKTPHVYIYAQRKQMEEIRDHDLVSQNEKDVNLVIFTVGKS
jgi:hypothetical protein